MSKERWLVAGVLGLWAWARISRSARREYPTVASTHGNGHGPLKIPRPYAVPMSEQRDGFGGVS